MSDDRLKKFGLAILILLAGIIPAHGTDISVRDGALTGTGWFENLEGQEVIADCTTVPFRFLDTFLSERGEWRYRIGDTCADIQDRSVYGLWHGGIAPTARQEIDRSRGTVFMETPSPTLDIGFGDDPAVGKGAVFQGPGMMVLLGCSLIGLASIGRKKSRKP